LNILWSLAVAVVVPLLHSQLPQRAVVVALEVCFTLKLPTLITIKNILLRLVRVVQQMEAAHHQNF
jgi:hypothetical protein